MANNELNRYLFEDLSVRGELVQLDEVFEQIVSGQDYPTAVKTLLGELVVATTLLTATLKFEGSITLQLQGDGPVSLAVINGDNEQNVRGVARYEGEIPATATLHELLGKGHLVITIEPKQGERYQGIVPLEGNDLAEVLEGYFVRSEQLKTRLWIKTGEHDSKLHAAGMMLQVVPDGKGQEEDFEHLEQLTATIKAEELFSLPANEVLYRLYNQDKVQLFAPQTVTFKCSCSRERSAGAIVSLPVAEVEDILAEFNEVALHCDYCGTTYKFDENEVKQLIAESGKENKTLH